MSDIAGLVSFADSWFAGCAEACAARLTPLLGDDEAAGLDFDLLGPAVFGVPRVGGDGYGFSRLMVDESAGVMLVCNGVTALNNVATLTALPSLYRRQGLDGLRAAAPPGAAGALWDARTAELTLFCGEAGGRPLYYRRDGHTVLFTTCETKTFDTVTQGGAISAHIA